MLYTQSGFCIVTLAWGIFCRNQPSCRNVPQGSVWSLTRSHVRWLLKLTSLLVGPNVRSMETYLCWDPQPQVSWCDQPGKVHSWNHTELCSFPCLSYIFCNEVMTRYVANDFHGFGDDRNFHLTKDSILIGYCTGRTALLESCFMARVATQLPT